MQILTKKLITPLCLVIVILCLVFGAAGAFVVKKADGDAEWKYPYIYFYEVWKDVPFQILAYDLANDPNLYSKKLDDLLEGTKKGFKKAAENLLAKKDELNKTFHVANDTDFRNKLDETFKDLEEEVNDGSGTGLYKTKLNDSLNDLLKESNENMKTQRSVAEQTPQSAASALADSDADYGRQLDALLAEFRNAVKRELEDEDLAEDREYLDKAFYMASDLPAEDVSALWYATVLPALFGMVIAGAFLIGEIVFLILLCKKIWLKGLEGSEKFAVRTGLAAYLTYLSSSCTLLMIGKTVIPAMGGPLSFSPAAFAAGTAVSFSPVTIVGLILGALLCGALFLGKYLSGGRVRGQDRPASRTVSQVCQIILFAATIILINLPMFKLNGVGNVGFFESFILFCIEPKYDSLEMFLALFGFIGSVVLIVACAKGIYNHVYDLLYGGTGLGAGKVSPATNILSVVLSCLAGLTALAFFGVFWKAYGILVPSREEFPLSVTVYLPILLFVIPVANLLVSIFAEKIKKN